MSHKMNVSTDTINQFLSTKLSADITDATFIGKGEWSTAYGFTHNGQKLVIRLGNHEDDFLKDQFAGKFASAELPIPKVLEVGRAFEGYFAISELAIGSVMLDDLSPSNMRQTAPSLLAVMDAIRATDVSDSAGFGPIDVSGDSKYASWYDYLMAVDADTPDTKSHGWKAGLAASPVGMQPFNEGLLVLREIAQDLPPVRTLVHNDLLHWNVLVDKNQVTGVIDWANAFYGDFLYDVAQFTFWGPLLDSTKEINWEATFRDHYRLIGLEVPEYDRRLQCYMLNMGLGAMGYYGYTKDWTHLEWVANRTLELAKN